MCYVTCTCKNDGTMLFKAIIWRKTTKPEVINFSRLNATPERPKICIQFTVYLFFKKINLMIFFSKKCYT